MLTRRSMGDELDGSALQVSLVWAMVAALGLVLFVVALFGAVRFVRWLLLGRRRDAALLTDLRERVTRLADAQGDGRAPD
jgi:hypothetical protein